MNCKAPFFMPHRSYSRFAARSHWIYCSVVSCSMVNSSSFPLMNAEARQLPKLYYILDRLCRHYLLGVKHRSFPVIILPVFDLNPGTYRYPLSGF